MENQFEEFQKKRLLTSYFSVIMIISIVLFLFGVLGLSVISIKSVGNSFKEKLTVSIYLKEDIKNVEINQLKNSLTMSSYIKSLDFISKDEAAIFMKEEYGEDFVDDIGYNPLVNSIDINLKSDYVNNRILDSISNKILENKFVDEVIYDRDLISIMNNNLNKIAFWILPASIIFLIIAFLIINVCFFLGPCFFLLKCLSSALITDSSVPPLLYPLIMASKAYFRFNSKINPGSESTFALSSSACSISYFNFGISKFKILLIIELFGINLIGFSSLRFCQFSDDDLLKSRTSPVYLLLYIFQ